MKRKILVLTEETKRRLYNQNRDQTLEDRMKGLTIQIQKLVDSGYSKVGRREKLTGGIKKYYWLVLQEMSGGISV